MLTWKLILIISILLLLHTYVFYPLLLMFLKRGKKFQYQLFSDGELPMIDIIMAVYNEEKVIQQKLESIYASNYPNEKINILIGSDASDDSSEEIIASFQAKYNNIDLTRFKNRSGKTHLVNSLIAKAENDILVMTDANVFFEPDMLKELIKFFKDSRIGIVGANIINKGLKQDGISYQENSYITFDIQQKHAEGLIAGSMIGALGACYALRRDCFQPMRDNIVVDDFYIAMNVLKQGKEAILEQKAIAYEDVSNEPAEEFRRKRRISSGNYQNLFHFIGMLFYKRLFVSFAFFSHKVIRWIGPFLLIGIYVANLYLINENQLYYWLFIVQNCFISLIFVDVLLKQLNWHIYIVRLVSHFYTMNVALFFGFFKFLFGIKTSVWKPTKRDQ